MSDSDSSRKVGVSELPDGFLAPAESAPTANKRVPHLTVVNRVVDTFGLANLVFAQGSFWRWGIGVWERLDDREVRRGIHLHCAPGFTKSTVDSVLDLLKTEVFRGVEATQSSESVINCLNGELRFQDGHWVLAEPDREAFRISQIPVRYEPAATAPRFSQFLREVFRNDEDGNAKSKIVLEMIGYTLLQQCNLERFIILIGNGANGKSVLLRVVEALCGTRNVSAVNPSDFSNRFQRAHLQAKLANIVTEIAEGSEIADAELKAIVSGEILTAERKHRPPFDFRPYSTVWIGTNHMPRTRDFSDALFRRAKILTFNNRFQGTACDPHLKEKLLDELEGILNLALSAVATALSRHEFTECMSESEAKREWRLEADQTAQFAEERCELLPGCKTPSKAIYKAYERWASEEGIKAALSHNSLTRRLLRFGATCERGSGGERMLAGIRLKNWLYET
jgi:putative DNA primase/helicase